MPKTLIRRHALKSQLSVDFPQEGERIAAPQYTLRLSCPENVRKVEVAIDDGEFQACRQAAGHWWYDWAGYEDGAHEVVARIETQDGLTVSTEPHDFFVQL